MAELWNTHNIQAQKRLEVHGGKPDMMYFTPTVYNSQSCLITVDVENENACKRLYTENCPDYAINYKEAIGT